MPSNYCPRCGGYFGTDPTETQTKENGLTNRVAIYVVGSVFSFTVLCTLGWANLYLRPATHPALDILDKASKETATAINHDSHCEQDLVRCFAKVQEARAEVARILAETYTNNSSCDPSGHNRRKNDNN